MAEGGDCTSRDVRPRRREPDETLKKTTSTRGLKGTSATAVVNDGAAVGSFINTAYWDKKAFLYFWLANSFMTWTKLRLLASLFYVERQKVVQPILWSSRAQMVLEEVQFAKRTLTRCNWYRYEHSKSNAYLVKIFPSLLVVSIHYCDRYCTW